MVDPIQYNDHDYDRENFINFVKQNNGRDLDDQPVLAQDLNNLKPSTSGIRKICRKALRKKEQISAEQLDYLLEPSSGSSGSQFEGDQKNQEQESGWSYVGAFAVGGLATDFLIGCVAVKKCVDVAKAICLTHRVLAIIIGGSEVVLGLSSALPSIIGAFVGLVGWWIVNKVFRWYKKNKEMKKNESDEKRLQEENERLAQGVEFGH